jgi:hypothetical protein
MAVQIQGNGGVVADVGGTAFRAVKTSNMPFEHGALGHYRYGGFTGVLPAALTANSEVFQLRWTDSTRLCVIRKIQITATVSTTFFAAGVPVQIDLVKATGWTVQGTGGTAVAPAALLKRRTSMGSSLIASGDIRIATTAALGAGTKTLETLSLSAMTAPGPTANPGTIFPQNTTLFSAEVSDGCHPIVLVQNEGIVIRSVAVPITGTWQMSVIVDWAEVSSY